MDTTERSPMTRREARDLAAAGWAAYTLCALALPYRLTARGEQDRAKIVHVRRAACPVLPDPRLPSAACFPPRSAPAIDGRAERLVRWLQPTREYWDY